MLTSLHFSRQVLSSPLGVILLCWSSSSVPFCCATHISEGNPRLMKQHAGMLLSVIGRRYSHSSPNVAPLTDIWHGHSIFWLPPTVGACCGAAATAVEVSLRVSSRPGAVHFQERCYCAAPLLAVKQRRSLKMHGRSIVPA